jgi:hypothetical protein
MKGGIPVRAIRPPLTTPARAPTLAGEFGDQPVDLRLGADIDAARRLVKDQNPRLGEKPTSDQTLLLVASAQVLDALVKIRRLYYERQSHM